jgi:REP element-mobilizing transposase RayT
LRQAAKKSLKYPAVRFNGVQARAIGRGFGAHLERSQLTIWACAILPDHVHLVVARHRLDIEQIANLLKGEATRQLVTERIHPMAKMPTRNGRPPKAFARGQWSVYLDSEEDLRRAIPYVERNPIKEGLPAQHWRFVVPFTGLAMA